MLRLTTHLDHQDIVPNSVPDLFYLATQLDTCTL